MKIWLLDTVTISELRKNRNRQNPNVANWRQTISLQSCRLSVISILEIQTGMLKVREKDPEFANRLKVWLESSIMNQFCHRLLDVDTKVVQEAATFRAEHPMGVADALIAATASVYDLTLVTRNISDFQDTGIELLNPWEVEDT